jgi:GNAT superfamily N-acetyltransferase
MLEAYFDELAQRFPGGFDSASSTAADPADFSPPGGTFVVVRVGGEAVGCGGLRTIGEGVAEVKQMWVHKGARGQGIGLQLLGELERLAAANGASVVRLDTSTYLPEAVSLYRRAGYTEIPRYNDNPYAGHWFEKVLGERAGSTGSPAAGGDTRPNSPRTAR